MDNPLFDNHSFMTFFLFVLGSLFGSFANVVIYRMPKDESVVRPRSKCGSCGKQVLWYDNIPIVSWFILRGKCRFCKTKFSFRYPLVELIMGILFSCLYLKVGFSFLLLEYLIFAFGLVTSSFIDLDHMILPDEFTLSGVVLGLLGAWINPEREFVQALYGVLFGGGILWSVSAVYSALRKREGIGGGDIKLLAWIGAILGWTSVPFVVIVSSLVGSLVGVIIMSKSKEGLNLAIPFGPYLAFGALLYIFFGKELSDLYIQFFIPSFSAGLATVH